MNITSNKKIIFIVPELKFFLSHRLQLVQGLVQEGWNFIIVTSNDSKPPDELGISYRIFDTHRKKFSLFNLLKNGLKLISLIRTEDPKMIYAVSHRSIFLARIANFFTRNRSIYAISGMGSIFSSQVNPKFKSKNSTLQSGVLFVYKYLIQSKFSNFLLQNNDDYNFFIKSKIAEQKNVFIIEGNGLDKTKFSNTKVNKTKIKFVMISRLLKDKGIIEFLSAASILVNKYKDKYLEFIIYGDVDESNFNCLSVEEIKPYLCEQILYKGFSESIQNRIKESSVVVLPSYREGFSKVLMEAQANSRPVITTNVTGCRDVILDGKSGFLIEPANVEELVDKMQLFILNPKLINEMGMCAYDHAIQNFTLGKAIEEHLKIFETILNN